jgi:eukaryotic-like serine/threonine-protein kinase
VSAPPASLAAALRDRYALERELGRGGMATVYLARDLRHNRRVAVKVLHPDLARSLGSERFLREIEFAARLQHPHILPLFDSGTADGFLYYVMPYVEGESLRDRLNRERLLPVDAALQIAGEAAAALDYAHRQGVVHRDIKPENLLLSEDHCLVADFGIARALDTAAEERLTETGLSLGTPAYMSPEQGAGERAVDGRSDLYSLGCVVYEMLAGEPPFTGPSAQAIVARRMVEPPRSIRVVRDTVPESVEHAVQRALARVPADRFASAAEFAAALVAPTRPTSPVAPRPRWAVRNLGLALAGLGVLGAVAIRWLRPAPTPVLDTDLVAIAPFDVLEPTLALWQEGIVDVLSRNLDGAGPLRTVAPAVAIRRWRGPADAGAAQALGRRTGAQLVVFGQVVGRGADSVRLTATLLDAGSGRRLGEVEVLDTTPHMDALLQSLTVKLLQELGRERPVGAVRHGSISARPLPALKAFLRGEQFYRRMLWDSAASHYDHAIALDSGFALAHYRMATAVAWNSARSKRYRAPEEYARRAARLNQGQTTRDSLLLVYGPFEMLRDPADPGYFTHYRQGLAVLERASQLYPGDPEVWYMLGEARNHFHSNEVTLAQTLDAFDRAIELDSMFGPAYEHTVEFAIRLGDVDRARRYAAAYLSSIPTAASIPNLRIDGLLLDPARAGSADVARLIDTAAGLGLWVSWWDLAQWPDSGETAVRLARALLRPDRSFVGAPPYIVDSINRRKVLARTLAFRGHLREAYRTTPPYSFRWPLVWLHPFPDLALLGTVPADSAAPVFGRMLRGDSLLAVEGEQRDGLPWWAATRDSASLALFARRADSDARDRPSSIDRAHLRVLADAARAYLVLAKGDSAGALRAFAALPDSLCILTDCFFDKLSQMWLASALGQDSSAADIFDRWIFGRHLSPVGVLGSLERGRVAERLGQRNKAIQSYRFVVDVWRNADPELRPYVAEARQSLNRLVGEGE